MWYAEKEKGTGGFMRKMPGEWTRHGMVPHSPRFTPGGFPENCTLPSVRQSREGRFPCPIDPLVPAGCGQD